jgi:prophage regulatory protein
MESPFILPDELDAIVRNSDLTRRRMERKGLFPKRVKIAERKTAHRRVDIEEWCENPDAWVKRNAAGGGA